jgi:hypothetical protein
MQRSDHIEIHRIFQETGCEEVICSLVGWFYVDSKGKCITVQLSPPYLKQAAVATTLENFFEESDDDDDLTS